MPVIRCSSNLFCPSSSFDPRSCPGVPTCLSPDHRLVALARRRAREGAGGAAGVPARCRTPSDSLRREGTSRRAVWANCQSFTARLKNCLDATRGLPALLWTYWYAPRSRPSCRRVRRANRPSEDDPAVVVTATPNRSQLRKWPPPGPWEQSYALLQRSQMRGHRPTVSDRRSDRPVPVVRHSFAF